MTRGIRAALCVIAMMVRPSDAAEPARVVEPTGAVTLREVLALTLLGNPDLQAYSHELRATEARALQAGLRPNPTAAFQVEDLGGTLGWTDPELTLSIAQLIELGGKRRARVAVARGEAAVVQLDYEAARLALLSETHQRFLDALALQELELLAQETTRIAQEALATVRLKVRSGVASTAEITRAEVEVARARLDAAVLGEQIQLSRSRLSALWGTPVARFTSTSGRLDSLAALPSRDSLLARAVRSPEVERWEAELGTKAVQIELAHSAAVPDLELLAGTRARLESDDFTFVAGLALPLPLFDRNQGAVAEAESRSAWSSERLAHAKLTRQQQIVEAYSALVQDRTRIDALQGEVIPGAARAFSELLLGYQRGRFSYLDLLEARRTWTEARREAVVTFLDFHRTLAELERLLGGPISESAQGGRE